MKTLTWRHKAVFALVAGSALLVSVAAEAQQMGRDPYRAPARNASIAMQFEMQERNAAAASSSAAGLGALQQFVTTYNSSSTSIGNLNEVTQILSGGSSGSVGQATEQDSMGNQGSDATTDVQVDNRLIDRSRTNIAGNQSNTQTHDGATTNTSYTTNTLPPTPAPAAAQ